MKNKEIKLCTETLVSVDLLIKNGQTKAFFGLENRDKAKDYAIRTRSYVYELYQRIDNGNNIECVGFAVPK